MTPLQWSCRQGQHDRCWLPCACACHGTSPRPPGREVDDPLLTTRGVLVFLFTRLTDTLNLEGRDDVYAHLAGPRSFLIDVAGIDDTDLHQYEITIIKKRNPKPALGAGGGY